MNVRLYETIEAIKEANGGILPDGNTWLRNATTEEREERERLVDLRVRRGMPEELAKAVGIWPTMARQHNAGERWDSKRDRARPTQEQRLFYDWRSAEKAYATARRRIEGRAEQIALEHQWNAIPASVTSAGQTQE